MKSKLLIIHCLSILLLSSLSYGQEGFTLLSSQKNYKLFTNTKLKITPEQSSSFLKGIIEKLEKGLFKVLPEDILLKVRSQQYSFVLEHGLSHDGMFFPPGTHLINKANSSFVISLALHTWQDTKLEKLISHEFFHAVHFLLNPKEVAWVREGLAQFIEYKVHKKPNRASVKSAFLTSTTALEAIFDLSKPDKEMYGHSFLFFYFLYKNCGGEKLLWKITSNNGETGRKGIQQILSKQEQAPLYCQSFENAALRFELARVINSPISDYSLALWETNKKLPINNYLYNKLKNSQIKIHRLFISQLKSYLPVLLPAKSFQLAKSFLQHSEKLKVYQIQRHLGAIFQVDINSTLDPRTDLILVIKK